MPSIDLPEPPSPRSSRLASPPPRTGGFARRPNPRESSHQDEEVGEAAEAAAEVGVVLPPLSAVPVPLVSGLGDGADHAENLTPRRSRLAAAEEQPGRRASDEPLPKPSSKPSPRPSPRPSPGPSPSPRRSCGAAHAASSSNRGGSGPEATGGGGGNQALIEGGVSVAMAVGEPGQDSRSTSTVSVHRAFGQRSTKRVGVAARPSGDAAGHC